MNEKTIPIPSREAVISMQLQSLLNVAGTMANIACGPLGNSEHDGGKLDGGAKMAVETTLVRACERLDAILDRVELWDMTGYDKLANSLTSIYSAHQDLIKQQADSIVRMDAPSRRYSPVLVKLPDNRWIAVVGPLTDLDNAIIGIGSTPEAALNNFDDTFKGIASKEVLAWAESCATAEAANQPLPPHPSTLSPKNEPPKQMEPGGNPPSDESPRKRKNTKPDSNNSGPKRDGNPSET